MLETLDKIMYKFSRNKIVKKFTDLELDCDKFLKENSTFLGWLITLTPKEFYYLYNRVQEGDPTMSVYAYLLYYYDIKKDQASDEDIKKYVVKLVGYFDLVDKKRKGLIELTNRGENDSNWEIKEL